MDVPATSAIPRLTEDFGRATACIAELANAPLRRKCQAIQCIAEHGLQVEELTVGQLLQIAQETRR